MRNEASNGCQLQNLVFANVVQEDKNNRVEKPLARSDLRRKFRHVIVILGVCSWSASEVHEAEGWSKRIAELWLEHL